jgi:hypothetical protein
MKLRADARKVRAKRQPLTGEKEKGLAKTSECLSKFYKIKRRTRMENKLPKPNTRNQAKTKQIISKNMEEIPIADETFAGAGSSIQVQPVELRRQARGIKTKKPRGGSRGAMTRSLSGR